LNSLDELLLTIGHAFNDPRLLQQALTHSSYANESGEPGDYERLEFLGDAVLELVVSHLLLGRFPDEGEGALSRLRASAVNRRTLAAIARRLGLGEHLRLSHGEEKTGGRNKDTLLGDVFEAVIGAIYLDGGLGAAANFVERYFDLLFEEVNQELLFNDYKTRLQEISQARLGRTPVYRTVAASGPDHEKTFEIEVALGDRMVGRGSGSSKKQAEQAAAKQAFEQLQGEEKRE
jgi:ribonuclease-3